MRSAGAIAWYNSLAPAVRTYWHELAGSSAPVDAWSAFKAHGANPKYTAALVEHIGSAITGTRPSRYANFSIKGTACRLARHHGSAAAASKALAPALWRLQGDLRRGAGLRLGFWSSVSISLARMAQSEPTAPPTRTVARGYSLASLKVQRTNRLTLARCALNPEVVIEHVRAAREANRKIVTLKRSVSVTRSVTQPVTVRPNSNINTRGGA